MLITSSNKREKCINECIFPSRKLFPQREKVCKTEEISQQDFIDQLIQEVGADADEMVVIEEDDAASVIDVTEMSSRYDD